MRFLRVALTAVLLASIPAATAQTVDPFGGYSDSVQGPCRHWAVITPSDTVDLVTVPKAIYVGGGGDLKMIGVAAPAAAAGVVWSGVPSASLLPVRPRRILATGTTATLIVACY